MCWFGSSSNDFVAGFYGFLKLKKKIKKFMVRNVYI